MAADVNNILNRFVGNALMVNTGALADIAHVYVTIKTAEAMPYGRVWAYIEGWVEFVELIFLSTIRAMGHLFMAYLSLAAAGVLFIFRLDDLSEQTFEYFTHTATRLGVDGCGIAIGFAGTFCPPLGMLVAEEFLKEVGQSLIR